MGHVVARSRSDWPLVGAAWLLLLATITLLTSLTLYGEGVVLGGLRSRLATLPIVDRSAIAWAEAAGTEYERVDGTVRSELDQLFAVGGPGIEAAGLARQTWLWPAPGQLDRGLSGLVSYPDMSNHATLAAGRWPVPGSVPVQAALNEVAAAELGITPGTRIMLADRRAASAPVEVEISGLYRPIAGDPLWVGPSGDEALPTSRARFAPTVVRADLLKIGSASNVQFEWRLLVDVDRLQLGDLAAVRETLRRMPAQLNAALGGNPRVEVRTPLADSIATAERAVVVSGSGFAALMAQFAVLGGYAITLVSGMLLERRRTQFSLLRTRGGSPRDLALLGVGESALLAGSAAVVSVIVAAAVVGLLAANTRVEGSAPVAAIGINTDALVVASASAIAAAVGLMLPTLLVGANMATARAGAARPAQRGLMARLGVDVLLLALAGIALWQLRLYGGTLITNARGVIGADPLLVLTPALALLAGSFVAIRLLPRLAELAERRLVARRGLVGALWVRQLARRPLRQTRAALLLVLTVALAVFSAAYGATWARSQSDQARFQAVGDVRVVDAGSSVPSWAAAGLYRQIEAVESVSRAYLVPLRVGRAVTDGSLLGVDPASPLWDADQRATLAPIATRPATDAAPLPGTPRRLVMALDTSLVAADGSPAWPAVGASVVYVDAAGEIFRTAAEGQALSAGSGQQLSVPLIASAAGREIEPTYPIALIEVEFLFHPPQSQAVTTGAIELRTVAMDGAAAGVALDPLGRWAWTAHADVRVSEVAAHPANPLRVELPQLNLLGTPRTFSIPIALRLAAGPANERLPAIASTAFLAATGGAPGSTVRALAGGRQIELELRGTTEVFAPLGDGRPFVVVDAASLAFAAFIADRGQPSGDEWWLAISPGGEREVRSALESHGARDVRVRAEIARELADDPTALALIGALGLGSVAALLFAALGFLVTLVTAIRERVAEIAVLRALGASRRDLAAWLIAESGFVLLLGIVGGALLGLVLAWLVLPFSGLTQSGEPALPRPVIVLPLELLPLGVGVAAVLLVAAVIVVRRLVAAAPVAEVLRNGEA